MLAQTRFRDQGTHALGRVTVEIAGAVRRLVKVGPKFFFQLVQLLCIKGILDNDAAVPLQYFVYHAVFSLLPTF